MTAKKMYYIIESARRALRNWEMDKMHSRSRDYIDYAIGEALTLKEKVTIENWSMYHGLMCQIEAYNESMTYQQAITCNMHRIISNRGVRMFQPPKGMFYDIFKATKKWAV